jgi:hypothetical protein
VPEESSSPTKSADKSNLEIDRRIQELENNIKDENSRKSRGRKTAPPQKREPSP